MQVGDTPPTDGAEADGEDYSTVDNKRKRRNPTHNVPTDNNTSATPTTTPANKGMPPFIFKVPSNWGDISFQLNNLVKSKITVKSKGSTYLLQTTDITDYRQAKQLLIKSGIAFHSYYTDEPEDIKIALKGLHHTHDPADVATVLTKLGYTVSHCINIKGRAGRPVNVFYLKIKKTANYESIYTISHLFHVEVTLEPFKPRPGLPQCFNCQRYGHSSVNCNHPPRCVKCGEGHDAAQCKGREIEQPSCCNCSGPHTANYRGCPHHLKLIQQRKRTEEKGKTTTTTTSSATPPVNSPPSTSAQSISSIQPQPNVQKHFKTTKFVTKNPRPVQPQNNPIKLPQQHISIPQRPVFEFKNSDFPSLPSNSNFTSTPTPSEPQSPLMEFVTSSKFITWVFQTLPKLSAATNITEIISVLINSLPSLLQ